MSTNLSLPLYRIARHEPERLALTVGQSSFTYREIATRSERIAAWLRRKVGPHPKVVGILASRTWEAYAGILGTCWAGAAYVPLNPTWPELRLLRILDNLTLDAVVVDERGLKTLACSVLRRVPRALAPGRQESLGITFEDVTITLSGSEDLPPHDPEHAPEEMNEAELAYIMFTSGTTGSPKGVMVTTGNVSSFLAAMQHVYPFMPDDRASQTYDLTFDPSVLDMFATWSSGASLHVVPANQLMGPSRFIREKAVTVWSCVPSTVSFMQNMKLLGPGAFPSIRYSIFCGEPLPASLARAWQAAAPNSAIDNLYGPTEATVVCIGQRCTSPLPVSEGRGTVSIGKPFKGMKAAIVDSSLRFLPPGERGELALSGKQVAQGYFNDERKTAARFPRIGPNTWYLTGDLAYQDAEGRFHHLGRVDNQIKVLGNRVELEDVEAHLREICGTGLVAAVPWPVINGSAEGIVAFVAGSGLSSCEIRQAMQRRVPKHMVPRHFRFMEALPLSSSGKIDRKALANMLAESTS